MLKYQNFSSLEQILNSSPFSGRNPVSTFTQAGQSVPINIEQFNLPPKINVPTRAGRLFRRDAVATTLGGSGKVTFPHPRNRNEGPTYACVKEVENELLPKNPGEHGIILGKELPESLVYFSLLLSCL